MSVNISIRSNRSRSFTKGRGQTNTSRAAKGLMLLLLMGFTQDLVQGRHYWRCQRAWIQAASHGNREGVTEGNGCRCGVGKLQLFLCRVRTLAPMSL